MQQPSGRLLDRPLLELVPINWEIALYMLLILAAGLLRFWDLGSRAFHHDESLHALYSWYLYTGRGYQHHPMMHGPFQFHFTALVYFILGASDYTARVAPALLGTAAVALPYFMRSLMGKWGALATAALLAFSPSVLYFSRFARNDIYILFWTLILIIGLWRYMEEGRSRYLYLVAAALSLSFATKEVTFITVAIFGSYLAIIGGKELIEWLFHPSRSLSPSAQLLVLVGSLAMPQISAATRLVLEPLGVALPSYGEPGNLSSTAYTTAGGITLLIFLISSGIGLLWDRRRWLISALIFYSIYVLLYTTFFTNPTGLATGVWGSLDYWLVQHGVQRGGQPWYYYLVLLPIYEFLPLALAAVAVVYYTIKRERFGIFLAYWVALAFLLYSVAGEKMPWLVLHLALPLILLGGRLAGELLSCIFWGAFSPRYGFFILALVLFPLSLKPWLLGESGGVPTFVAWAAISTFILGVLVYLAYQMGWRTGLAWVGVVTMAVAGLFSLRAAIQASFYHGDTPVEMLVYTQTSPDVTQVLARIQELARQREAEGPLKVTVDATDGFSWPWAWYLRDMENVGYPTLTSPNRPPEADVLLVHANNYSAIAPYLDQYGPPLRLRLRWWFPEETYRSLTPQGLYQALTTPANWSRWWDYFLYRKLSKPLGSVDAYALFPKDFAPTRLPSRQTAPSQEGLWLTGQPLSAEGLLLGPRGVAVDKEGNLYVADSGHHRLLKFDAQGKLIGQVGQQGSQQFNEPWGVAVDNEGNVYVADTWNHRIQKFSPSLELLTGWGSYGQAPGQLYGPRDIAVDAQGNLYVTDTGNKRIQKFAPDGTLLASFGGPGAEPGAFSEPVGIAISPQGDLFVADTWNRRIQRFDKSFNFILQFPIEGWEGQAVLNKPYLRIDAEGNLWATDPTRGRLLRFTPQGKPLPPVLGIDGTPFSLPIGLASDSRGILYVSDGTRNVIFKLQPPP
ncbi:MAG: TIGR03663 family protein [Chloroflexi bacterium]|nr:TIGR03663 family protein [Chloroflexota bacterium]